MNDLHTLRIALLDLMRGTPYVISASSANIRGSIIPQQGLPSLIRNQRRLQLDG
jgi:hypothetical protein